MLVGSQLSTIKAMVWQSGLRGFNLIGCAQASCLPRWVLYGHTGKACFYACMRATQQGKRGLATRLAELSSLWSFLTCP